MMPYFTINDLQYRLRRTFTADQVATALHEASHAVVAMALGHRVTEVSIEHKPHGVHTWRGRCQHQGYRSCTEVGEQVDRALIIAAPLAALEFADGMITYAENGAAQSDHRDFAKVHQELASALPYLEFQRQCTRTARGILATHSTALENITAALLLGGRLDEDDLQATPGGVGLRWEAHQTSSAAPRQTAPPPRRSSPPRRGTGRTMRDVVPGLRYSAPAPMTPRGRAA